VIEDREQPRAPPVAREEQGTVRRLDGLEVEERAEILVGCGRVPEVELDALPHLDPIRHGSTRTTCPYPVLENALISRS
jgi:hypothetical protein